MAACAEGNPRIQNFDTSCFSNHYVTGVPDDYFKLVEQERSDHAKQARREVVSVA